MISVHLDRVIVTPDSPRIDIRAVRKEAREEIYREALADARALVAEEFAHEVQRAQEKLVAEAARLHHVATGSVVYYIGWRSQDVIKIGVSQNLEGRMRGLRMNGEKPFLICTEPGGFDVEMKRHRQFSHLRVRGTELFRWVPQLQEHCDALRPRLRRIT